MKKKLFIRIGLSIFFMGMFDISSDAQIIYTDIIPDSSYYFSGCPSYPCSIPCNVCGTPHYFNLNNDVTNDFHLAIDIGGGSASCMGFASVNWSNSI